jgi:hypothetical protein
LTHRSEQKWLAVCGLPTNGNILELKERVMGFLSLPIKEQPVMPLPAYGKTEGVLNMI